MFSGFWGWFLVVVIVAVIFGAGKLPDLKEQAEDKLKFLAQAAEKGKKELEAKINEAKKKNASKEDSKEADEPKVAEESKDMAENKAEEPKVAEESQTEENNSETSKTSEE